MDLEDYFPQDTAPALELPPRKCGHPKDRRVRREDLTVYCNRCNAELDPARLRQGKRADRLGKDNERRIQKVYGPVKIGQRGDPVDHIGRIWRWQSKATRSDPPAWLAAIEEPLVRIPPLAVIEAYHAMAGLYDPRLSVVIRSFIRHGMNTRDWLFIGAVDGLAEFALPDPVPELGIGWWVVPGHWWLDRFGRDE